MTEAESRKRILEISRIRGVTFVRVRGTIDDQSARELQSLSKLTGCIILDLDDVRKITSYGVRQWSEALDAMASEYFCFIRCRPALVTQFNMIKNFGRRGEVMSFYAPFVCPSCNEEFDVLHDARANASRWTSMEHAPCPRCRAVADFDDVPQSYFSHMLSAPAPQPPPLVDAILCVPFRVGKEVTENLTVLWLTGILDSPARLKRAVDGLEGRVLVLMDDLLALSAEGAGGIKSLCEFEGADVLLARVPLGVALQLLDTPDVFGKARVLAVLQSIVCESCGHHQRIEIDKAFLAATERHTTLCCTHCRAALVPKHELERLRELPWEAMDPAVANHLASMGPTATEQESSPYPVAPPSEPTINIGGGVGRYEFVRTLGHGGMGTVYLARSLRAGGFERSVAIKKMHPHLAEHPDCIAMFLDEARLAANIHHPNVVATLDVVQSRDGVSLVMDYVDGLPLSDIVEAGERVPAPIALRILLDALAGLHAAHEACDEKGQPMKLVHRDISAKNLLVGIDGATRLVDFGIALSERRRAQTTNPGYVKGTLGYIAPEQARGDRVDRRADVFGIGLVACEAFFVRTTAPAVLDAYLRSEELAAKLNELNLPPLERSLVGACEPAVRLDPAQRYPTALAFLEALEAAAASAGLSPANAREVGSYISSTRRRLAKTQSPEAAS